jgi:hypothetical protein
VNSPGSARPACPGLAHPVRSAGPALVATQGAEPAHPGSCPAARSRRTCHRGRRRRTHWACRSAQWGRNESGRRDSGRHRAARKGWPGRSPADRHPCQQADPPVPQPRSLAAVPPGRVPSARRSLRPAPRHRTVAGPDRRWPRWSPNRPSGSLTCCPAEDRAREPVTGADRDLRQEGRFATVPTPDVIPYQRMDPRLDLLRTRSFHAERASSTVRGARLSAGGQGRRVLCVRARMPG